MVPAEHLPVGTEPTGLGLPFGPLLRVGGDLAEGLGGPQRPFLRGVFADAALPVVHRRGDLAMYRPSSGSANFGRFAVQESPVLGGRCPVMLRILASRTGASDRA